jgi:hypothetical protein
MQNEAIIKELRELLKPRWMDPKQLETEYGFSVNRQARLRAEKIIPFHKIGSYIRYDRHEIDRWIEEHRVV